MKNLMKFIISVGITGLLVVSLCLTCFAATVDDVKNNVSGHYSFNLNYQEYDYSQFYTHKFFDAEFGKYQHFAPAYDPNFSSAPYIFNIVVYFSFTVTSPCDIYIGVNSSSDVNDWDFQESGTSNSIFTYHSSSGDFTTQNFNGTSYGVTFVKAGNQLSSTVGSGSNTSISSVKFYYFDNVPAGNYGFSCVLSDPYVLTGYGAGIYIFDPSVPLPQTVIDQFNNGELNFSQAIDQIYNQYQSEVNSVSSVEEKIFVVEKYQYFTKQLEAQVNTMGVSSVRSFTDSSTQYSSSYRAGTISVSDALDGISSSYRNHLNGCNTVEEVTALNTEYQFVMSEMQNFADEKASAILSQSNSSTKTVIDEYDSLESYFTDQLVVQDFQDLWNLVTPADFMDSLSSLTLRNIVEALLADTYISNYILLPLTLLPLTIILTTGIYSKSRNHDSRGED